MWIGCRYVPGSVRRLILLTWVMGLRSCFFSAPGFCTGLASGCEERPSTTMDPGRTLEDEVVTAAASTLHLCRNRSVQSSILQNRIRAQSMYSYVMPAPTA